MINRFFRFMTKVFIIPKTLYCYKSLYKWRSEFIKRQFFLNEFMIRDSNILKMKGIKRYIISWPYAISIFIREKDSFIDGVKKAIRTPTKIGRSL